MNRRNFITATTLAAAGAASLQTVSGNPLAEDQKSESQEKNFNDHFELNEITVTELQEKMNSHKLSSEQITQLYLKRIEEIDRKGPAINSVIELNLDALSIAKAMDAERKNGKVRGPLI